MRQLIEELARDLNVSEANIRKWRSRGFVPHKYRTDMLAMAARRGKKLKLGDFQFATVGELRAHQAEAQAA